MRLHDLQRKARRDGRIERVAALLQNSHAGRSGQPMRRRHDTERAEDFGSSRELIHARLRARYLPLPLREGEGGGGGVSRWRADESLIADGDSLPLALLVELGSWGAAALYPASFVSRTSRKSRNASPMKLMDSTVSMMARPGKTPSHHAREMKLRASERINPQVGVDGSTPSP